MICPPCRKAGRKNAQLLYTRAEQLHLKCQYPATCTCQHVTGNVQLNQENRGTK
jgi:hypothetical protein